MSRELNIVDEWAKLPHALIAEIQALDILEKKAETVLHGYTYRAYPDDEQKQFFAKSFGCTRQFWNILVDDLRRTLSNNSFEGGELPKGWLDDISQHVAVKERFPYMEEIDSLALSNTRLDFVKSAMFYNKQVKKFEKPQYQKKAKRKSENTDYELSFRDLKWLPDFHAKFYSEDSYSTNAQKSGAGYTVEIVSVVGRFAYVKLPKMKNLLKIRLHRDIPEGVKIKGATIKKVRADYYTISFRTEQTIQIVQPKTDEESLAKLRRFLLEHSEELCLGLDYDQEFGCVPSNGDEMDKILETFTKAYRRKERKIAALQRKLAKKQQPNHKEGIAGSKAYQKLQARIAVLQAEVADFRRDALAKLSTAWANYYFLIGVEDINLTAMSQCLKLAKNLLDNGFGMFRRMLEYKLRERGKLFMKIYRFFASSQICHACGRKNPQMKDTKNETLVCPRCGAVIHRDVNAALNIRDEAIRTYEPLKENPSGMAAFRAGRHKKKETTATETSEAVA